MDFATIIRDARVGSGLSQTGLAVKANVSLDAVSDLEVHGNGTVQVLAAITAALDLRFAGLPRALTFGDQVRLLRERRGWTQERLAERARVSAPAIGRSESVPELMTSVPTA